MVLPNVLWVFVKASLVWVEGATVECVWSVTRELELDVVVVPDRLSPFGSKDNVSMALSVYEASV